MTKLTPSRSMSSRRQLVLESIRRHFRAVGASPSHREIAQETGLTRQHVGRWLDELQAAGVITYTPGRARSIVLVDRAANFSDAELHLACAGRGWTVTEPALSVQPLATAYPVDPVVPEFGLAALDALKHVP
ncbi:helix-turn-helix domain-containing protein [Sphingomonas sp. T9W2]|uniref:LexA family protein n=1 Tax=Sphingomonas sp. T9W2 TaxID=3143183 RepID=UPI0031F4C7A9